MWPAPPPPTRCTLACHAASFGVPMQSRGPGPRAARPAEAAGSVPLVGLEARTGWAL